MTIEEIQAIASQVVNPQYAPPQIPEGFHWGAEISGAYYWFLYEAMKQFQLSRAVELGLSTGASALMLGMGNSHARVFSIEIRPQGGAIESLHAAAPNVRVIVGDSLEVAKEYGQVEDIDLLFLDTEHSDEHVLAEYAAWSPCVKPGRLILIDDIEWSKGTWGQLPEPKVKLNDLHPGTGFGALIKTERHL